MISKEERNIYLEKQFYLNYLMIKIRATNIREYKNVLLDLFKFIYSINSNIDI
jgi:hypothetical protein